MTLGDRGESGLDLQVYGRRLLTSLYAAFSALKLYPLENEAVQKALEDLHNLITSLGAVEGKVELSILGDFFFLNETRLRLDLTNFSTFGAFARSVNEHGIGVIELNPGVTKEELVPFLSLLLRDPTDEDPFGGFLERLNSAPVDHIEIRPERDVPAPNIEEEEGAMYAAKRTYAQSVRVAKDTLTDVRVRRAVNVRKVKRAVQGIVDQVLSDQPSMVTMTTLRDFDEYTFTHSVNVCIFSVIIGQRIGLSKLQLYELGLGALFHDVGKMRIDPEILNKRGDLTDEEWTRLKEHPTEGLLTLFQMHGFTEIPYHQMLMAYEHHMKVDASGYPTNKRPRLPGLFARIVAVADGFDAGTSVRSYQYDPAPADQVLREMRDNPERGFDKLIVKLFINETGVFPVGTLVVLDSLELAIVAQANTDPEKLQLPVVKVVSNYLGLPLAEPRTVDLSELNPATGRPVNTIIKTTDPQKYGLRVSDYLI